MKPRADNFSEYRLFGLEVEMKSILDVYGYGDIVNTGVLTDEMKAKLHNILTPFMKGIKMEKPLLISRETIRIMLVEDEPQLTEKEIEDFINKELCSEEDLTPLPNNKYPTWKTKEVLNDRYGKTPANYQ